MAFKDRPEIDRELACYAYAAYGNVTGGKNFRGDPMPAFDDLTDQIKEAWAAASQDVRERTEDRL
jgi:hypothetical protein